MPIKLPSSGPPRRRTRRTSGRSARRARRCCSTSSSTRSLRVCPKCGHHFRLRRAGAPGAAARRGTFEERDAGLAVASIRSGSSTRSRIPIGVAAAQLATGLRDAAIWGDGRDRGHPRRDLRHGLRVHGRLDGRGRRREGHPRRGGGTRERDRRSSSSSASGGARMQEGHARADAAGQDRGRASSGCGGRRARTSRS